VCVVDGRLDVNVALNRPSWSSSVLTDAYGTHGPSMGNDGDKTNCNGFSTNSLVHTQTEVNPWFGVDLGVALYVAGVRLTNRGDVGGAWGKSVRFPSLYYSPDGDICPFYVYC